jgi:predicted nucleic acid-binding Zn ribbon protein
MRSATPRRIGTLIPSLLDELGLSRRLRDYEVLNRWPEIAGKKIAAVTGADRLTDGRLWISVSHSAWRNELQFIKKELIDKINGTFGETIVRDIIFR